MTIRSQLLIAAGVCLAPHVAGLSPHVQFKMNEGLIEVASDSKLRLNVKGGDLNAGDPLVLWECAAHMHEMFVLDGHNNIKSEAAPDMCLNAEGGPNSDARIVLWQCNEGGSPAAHEQFAIQSNGRITLKDHKNMCLNAKGGNIQHGTELILYQCHDEVTDNEQFFFQGGLIKSKAFPDFHLNVKGGELKSGSQVIFWGCQPAAHEIFEFQSDQTLRVAQRKDLCLNAEGGLVPGNRIVAWHCSETPGPNEKWVYDSHKKVIKSVENPTMGFNVKGAALQPGTEVVVWQLEDDEL